MPHTIESPARDRTGYIQAVTPVKTSSPWMTKPIIEDGSDMSRNIALFVTLLAALGAGCGGDGGSGVGGWSDSWEPVTLEARFPIDGEVDFSALSGVEEADLVFIDLVTLAQVKNTHLKWAAANDDRDLYVALQWTDDTADNQYDFSGPLDVDAVLMLIDNDGDGTHADGEDKRMLFAAAGGAQYIDQHKAAGNDTDSIGDGLGWLRYYPEAQKYQAEFRFPMQEDALGEDGDVSAASRVNFILLDHFEPGPGTGAIASLDPELDDSSAWPALPVSPVAPMERPGIPDGLTGLVVFTSTHEDANGEIYTFEPATGIVTRVTSNTLIEENVSLSHDRSTIAFHGTPDRLDGSQYEIYRVDVDGGNWTQLTSNGILDGHPGWSPDDTRIVYASFRDAKASIVVMTADGTEIADLIPPWYDDNDPDWLPDGRIIFKTDRFSAFPELRIAVMNDDGSDVRQVTSVDGVVDHDPMGDLEYTVFERLMASKDYSSDITALFEPWNIIEARLDGTSERVLVNDVFVKWLPVYDPTGQYLVYLKSPGYTEARLITRTGKDLGRLIPSITKLTYIDWK